MRSRWIQKLVALPLVWLCSAGLATTVTNLTTGVVAVADRSDAGLEAALPQALNQVLVKISGNESIGSVPVVSQALVHAKDWMQGFSYQNTDTGLRLSVDFNKEPLYQLLRNTGQTIWGDDRPQTLFWVQVVPYGDAPTLLVSDVRYTDQLQQAINARGLASMLPMGDLDDQSVLDQALVDPKPKLWLDLIERYGVQALCVTTIKEQAPGSWQASETLLYAGQSYRWQQQGDSIDALLGDAVDHVADTMANQLAVLQAKSLRANMQLQVDGVENLQALQQVIASLRRLTPVDSLQLQSINGKSATLNAEIAGGDEQLLSALRRHKHLRVINNDDNRLTLQWRAT